MLACLILLLQGLAQKQIHEKMLKVYKDPSTRTIARWVSEFKLFKFYDVPLEGCAKIALQ